MLTNAKLQLVTFKSFWKPHEIVFDELEMLFEKQRFYHKNEPKRKNAFVNIQKRYKQNSGN